MTTCSALTSRSSEGGEEAVEKVKPVAIPANVKVAGLEEAMDEMKELVALLEKPDRW